MNKIIGIFLCMLMVIPVLSTTAYVTPGPEFEINHNSIYFGELWFDIKNIGDIDAIDVEWIISLDISVDIPGIPPPWNGSIDIISVGETERILTYTRIFGFGIYPLIVELKANGVETVKFNRIGIFLGPIVIVLKPLSQ